MATEHRIPLTLSDERLRGAGDGGSDLHNALVVDYTFGNVCMLDEAGGELTVMTTAEARQTAEALLRIAGLLDDDRLDVRQ